MLYATTRRALLLPFCLIVSAQVSAADVAQLTSALNAPNAADRYAAADSLADLGYAAQPAVPQLIKALQSEDVNLRWRAARALGVIGHADAIEPLRRQAVDPEVIVRAQVVFALGRLKAADEATLKAVVERVSDSDPQVRRAAIRALRMIEAPRGQVAPLVAKLLNDAEPTIAMRALSTIVEGGVEVVPALSAALDEREARYWAALALSEIGPQAKDAVPNLIKVLSDDRPEVRLQATIALGEIGPDAKAAVGELAKLLSDPFESIRVATIFALGRISDPAAVDALVKVEASTDPFQKMMATWALAKIHKTDQQRTTQAVQRLVAALGDQNRDMANMAARALADLEVDPAKVRPQIEQMVAKKPEVSDRILSAFASLGARAVPHAINSLKDPQVRVRAMQVLARVGPDAAPAVPALLDVLKAGDAQTKIEALYALGAVGPGAEAAVMTVGDQLGDADPKVVEAAIFALGKIGAAARPVVPTLAKLAGSQDALVRLMSVTALLRIGPLTKELVQTAMPVLTEGLKHQREFVRIEAAMALGELGPQGQAALPALQTAASDTSAAVRSAAAAAIKKIKG